MDDETPEPVGGQSGAARTSYYSAKADQELLQAARLKAQEQRAVSQGQVLTWAVGGLSPGARYQFRVVFRNVVGWGPMSLASGLARTALLAPSRPLPPLALPLAFAIEALGRAAIAAGRKLREQALEQMLSTGRKPEDEPWIGALSARYSAGGLRRTFGIADESLLAHHAMTGAVVLRWAAPRAFGGGV